MNKKEIISSIIDLGSVSVPLIQQKFGISYREAKCIVDEMVGKGELMYTRGVVYCCTVKRESEDGNLSIYNRVHKLIDADKPESQRFESSKPMSLREYFERKAKQYELKNNGGKFEDGLKDESGAPVEDKSDFAKEEELRRNALQLCIKKNNASVSFLQRVMPIGYIKACKLIDWMEEQGYITAPKGAQPRQILITEEEFNKKFNPVPFVGDDDDEDEDEDPFEALERFQHNKLMEELFEEEESSKTSKAEDLIRKLNETKEKIEMIFPTHYLWSSEFEFIRTVRQKKEEIIKSDKNMGIKGAIKKAETKHKELKDKGDEKLAEIYERIVYDFRHTTPYEYAKMKRRYF